MTWRVVLRPEVEADVAELRGAGNAATELRLIEVFGAHHITGPRSWRACRPIRIG